MYRTPYGTFSWTKVLCNLIWILFYENVQKWEQMETKTVQMTPLQKDSTEYTALLILWKKGDLQSATHEIRDYMFALVSGKTTGFTAASFRTT